MEKSRYGSQHVQQIAMIRRTASARRSQQPDHSRALTCQQPEKPRCPRRKPAVYSPGANMAPLWLPRGRLWSLSSLLILVISLWAVPTSGAFIRFDNCLPDNVQSDTPLQLQFVPKFLDAKYNTTDPNNNLQVTVYGNVTGANTDKSVSDLPPPDDQYWSNNQTDRGGKIESLPPGNPTNPRLTTLFEKVEVLSYAPYNDRDDFCQKLVNAACPLGPRFGVNGSVPFLLFFLFPRHAANLNIILQ